MADDAQSTKPTPRRGSMIDYHFPPSATKAHERPFKVGSTELVEGSQNVAPAVVQGVNQDGSLRLAVFGPHAGFGPTGYSVVTPVYEGGPDNPGSWSWPS